MQNESPKTKGRDLNLIMCSFQGKHLNIRTKVESGRSVTIVDLVVTFWFTTFIL